MQQEEVDITAGDFTGASWRQRSGDDQRHDSSIQETFANANLPITRGSYAAVTPRKRPRRMGRRVWVHQAARHRKRMADSHARSLPDQPRSSGYWGLRSKLPSWNSGHFLHVNAYLVERERAYADSRDWHERRPLSGKRGNPNEHMWPFTAWPSRPSLNERERNVPTWCQQFVAWYISKVFGEWTPHICRRLDVFFFCICVFPVVSRCCIHLHPPSSHAISCFFQQFCTCHLAVQGHRPAFPPTRVSSPSLQKKKRACDRRVDRLISYIHNTKEYRQ